MTKGGNSKHTSTGNSRVWFSFIVFIILASLDNMAAGVLPPLYAIIARDLQTNEAAIGTVTSVYVLVTAVSAIIWGYQGDQGERKQLLLLGTILWGSSMALTGIANTFTALFGWQIVTAIGVGVISSVGFSVVSDYIPAHRRGLALSLWSMSQTIGAGVGALLAGSVVAYNWRWPFWIIAGLGFFFALLYLFTAEPPRGYQEPELRTLFAQGRTYTYRIKRADLRLILTNRANLWLLGQSFFYALAYGSTIWVPRWAIARVQAEGYSLEVATIVGNFFVTLFSVGVFLAVPAGYLGDRWQQRYKYGRVTLASIGLLSSIPFFILLFFTPLRGVTIPDTENIITIGVAVLQNLFTNGWVITAFFVAFIGLALFAADAPNWAALIVDVNLPEHRGTVIGISRLCRAIGHAISVSLTGILFTMLTPSFPPPQNYALGLSLFQIVVIPTALCYLAARHLIPQQITHVKQTLKQRSA